MIAMPGRDPADQAFDPMGQDVIDVRGLLLERGISAEELDMAAADGLLPLLVLDALMFSDRPRYDETTLVQKVGVDVEYARALWRAMGFPTAGEGEVVFYEDDLLALQSAASEGALAAYDSPGALRAAVVHQTRVMSAALARIAEQSTDDVEVVLNALRTRGASEEDIARLIAVTFRLGDFEELLWYMFRRQWRAAAWRRLARPAHASGPVVVGFVDLVRFAAITEQVADDELEQLILRFEELAHDAITDGGGRVVKMIGDAVMFVADEPAQATDLAMSLVDAYAHDSLLPPARAGLASGSALARDGDYYGPTVNLAARIVDIARPSHVVISDALHSTLTDADRYSFRRLPPKRLKGIGPSTLWAVRHQRH